MIKKLKYILFFLLIFTFSFNYANANFSVDWMFWWVIDSIKSWLQNWLEVLYPEMNEFKWALFWTSINPFDLPNGIVNILTYLFVLIIIVTWISYLVLNISNFSQKKTAKKAFLIILAVVLTIFSWSLFTTDEDDIIFNLSLVYKKADNINTQLSDLWYAWISAWQNFSNNPYNPLSENTASDMRTNISFNVNEQLWKTNEWWNYFKWSMKYTPDFKMAVWVNPLLWVYKKIVNNNIYLNMIY